MIPAELLKYPNWVVWKYEERDGRKTKVPYNAVTRQCAKSNDSDTWNTWDEVEIIPGWAEGRGFMFSESPFVGIDIDHCLDGGEKEKKAMAIVDSFGTYAEKSPSGDGLHMIGRAELVKGMRFGKIEIYPHGRYFTMTGDTLGQVNEICGIQDKLNEFIYKCEERKAKKDKGKPLAVHTSKAIPTQGDAQQVKTAAEVVEKIRQSEQAMLFSSLFDYGDTSAYKGDESAADMALMNILPFWTGGNFEMMREIFSLSALAKREKWSRRDYQDRTIQRALKDWNGQTYDVEQYKKNKRAADLKRAAVEREKATAELDKAAARLNVSGETLRELAFLPATDTGNAQRLKLVQGDNIKYLPEKGRGCAWVVWDGKKWVARYESGLYDTVSEIMEISQNAALVYASSTDSTGKLYKFLVNSCNQSKIDSCLKRARGMFEGSISDFDNDGYLLNVQNGIVDLKTGELLPHERERFCSKICRAEFLPELVGCSSLWTKTLADIIPDEGERRYLQKWAGYMLIGSAPEEKLLFLYGEGGSGKGTFANTLGYMLGDYADTVDIEIFLASRNDGHAGGAAASPEIAKLAGVRVAMASESGLGRKMNDAKVKNMTGRDDITARFLYGQPFTFTPAVKFVLQSNYLPAVHDSTDTGIRRRLVIAPFMENFENSRDVFLKEKLREPENLAAVLAWCVEGCLLWQKEGLGKEPKRYQRAARTFYEDSDTLQQFIDDECIIGEPGSKMRVPVKDFLIRYTDWVGERVKRKTLVAMMKRKGYNSHKFNNGVCFDGVDMRDNYPMR